MTKVLAVCGSLRQESHTRKLLKIVCERIAEAGGETRLLDLRETPLPMYNPDSDRNDPVTQKVREDVQWAEAFLLGSPDYHGSLSGPIKNFLDYFWHEFTGKLFGYIVATHEKGLTVQDQMRTAIRQCYGWSMPYGIGFNGDTELDANGRITNERLAERTQSLAHDLVCYGELIHRRFKEDLAADPRPPGFSQRFKL